MLFGFRKRIRHPLYPAIGAVLAADARGTETAIAGSVDELLNAADRGIRVRRAVLALQRPDGGSITKAERERLWEVFQAPLFVMLVDAQERVTAYECEAREGMHAASGTVAGEWVFEDAPCHCGRPGPRLFACVEAAAAD